MPLISRTGTHALKALVMLHELPPGSYAGAAKIAREIRAPSNYLGKLLRQLAGAGIVEGRKGSNGGFRLAAGRRSVALYEALQPIEHFERLARCFLGWPKCLDSSPCRAHKGWAHVRDTYLDFLKETTLSELAENQAPRARRKSGPKKRAARPAAGGVR
jgi:Rrf2 family protein